MEDHALAALYDAWASRLLGYMVTITRDRHLAEDALQNMFVKLAVSNPEMKNPAVYLFGAARNEALRVCRRRRERPLAELDVLAPRSPSETDGIASALDRLPREQSEVVTLHAFLEMTFKDIGEVLGISPDTVASRYRYAIEKLRSLLKDGS